MVNGKFAPFTIHHSSFTIKIMDNFFAAFTHEDSIAFLLSVLVCFLIGFLTAWLLWGGAAKRFQKEAEKWKKSYDDLMVLFNNQKEELELKEADLVKAQREAKEAIEVAKSLEAEKVKWQKDLDAALEDSVKAQATISSYQTTIEGLNNQIVGLKAMNADLTNAMGSSSSDSGDSEATLTRLNELEEKLKELEAEHENDDEAANRLAALEAKVAELETENDALHATLKEKETESEEPVGNSDEDNEIFAPAPETTDIDKGETVALTAVSAQDEVKAAIGSILPAATEEDKDDLTRIKGIGSFIEKKLNGLGIYTYEQISKFDKDMIDKVTAAIEFFPGRIERDDWVGQATRLMDIKEDTPEALEASAVFVKNIEDLKTVEGIGPKIEKLLKDNGVTDLKVLSETPDKRLREILFAAGSRYRIHDPTTWAIQAELAVKGEWDTLKDLQDKLKGGRDVG